MGSRTMTGESEIVVEMLCSVYFSLHFLLILIFRSEQSKLLQPASLSTLE